MNFQMQERWRGLPLLWRRLLDTLLVGEAAQRVALLLHDKRLVQGDPAL
jgi:hypothetical protein